MASVLSPYEVLSYLNELGYQNVTALQLKDFLYDLKRLIKYELKLKQKYANTVFKEKVHPKESYISIHVKNSKYSDNTKLFGDSLGYQNLIPKPNENRQKINEIIEKGSTATQDTLLVPSACSDLSSKSKTGGYVQLRGKPDKTKPIPKRGLTKTVKSDPVALYHQYQEIWKKQKFPGEDNHCQLRWAIRKQLLGETRSISTYPSSEMVAKTKYKR